jgi:hypothetical protein
MWAYYSETAMNDKFFKEVCVLDLIHNYKISASSDDATNGIIKFVAVPISNNYPIVETVAKRSEVLWDFSIDWTKAERSEIEIEHELFNGYHAESGIAAIENAREILQNIMMNNLGDLLKVLH